MSRKFGFKEVSDDEDWSLYWTDYSVALERVMDMKKYQVSTRGVFENLSLGFPSRLDTNLPVPVA